MVGIGPVIWVEARFLRRRGTVARRAGRRGRGGNSQLCRGLGIVGRAEDHIVDLILGLVLADRACRAVVEIAAVRRAARRDEGVAGLGGTRIDVAEGERDRAGDLVAGEDPTTPRGGRAPRRASGDAGGTRRSCSAVSWPISTGNVPVIWLARRTLRRRRSVALRAGRRGRGGNSQGLQRRELADLGRQRADDLVDAEDPATPRDGRAPRRASVTRGELAVHSAP